jgi:molecular chaperone GrpE
VTERPQDDVAAAGPAGEGVDETSFPVGEAPADTEVEQPLDPAAGETSEAPESPEAPEVPESPGDRLVVAERLAEERLADLQRLQAEYLNYKRRVERDRELVVQNAKFTALAPITEVLDNIDRAKDSAQSGGGELDPGFKSVADQLERVVATAGLVKFGAVGDPFDPTVHEALSHLGPDPEVTVTTCKVIAKAGYKIGDRVVRAAQVLVVDPVD